MNYSTRVTNGQEYLIVKINPNDENILAVIPVSGTAQAQELMSKFDAAYAEGSETIVEKVTNVIKETFSLIS